MSVREPYSAERRKAASERAKAAGYRPPTPKKGNEKAWLKVSLRLSSSPSPSEKRRRCMGIEVNRSGMACCPFHDDKNPSMKLNEEYFYCFGCGATGDVIDFTARLYNLSPKEAAEKLAQDFGLAYDSQAPPPATPCPARNPRRRNSRKEDRDHAFRVLADYFHLLRKWETDYTPKTPEENPHPRFMEAIQKKDYVGYLLDFFSGEQPGVSKSCGLPNINQK